jgi:hypothetical protein
MAGRTDVFDLGRLQLASGQGRQAELRVQLDDLEFGGQRYSSEDPLTDALLDVTRTRAGYSLRLRFEARLVGPCMRCLEEAHQAIEIDARARAARPDRVSRGVPGALRDLRREPERRGPRPRARARPGPALREARRAAIRLGRR